MFASRSLVAHVLRGTIGLAAFAQAGVLAPQHPLLALGLFLVALVALRGCPMCWTVGLVQTTVATLRGRPTSAGCVDGRCAAPARGASSDSRPESSSLGGVARCLPIAKTLTFREAYAPAREAVHSCEVQCRCPRKPCGWPGSANVLGPTDARTDARRTGAARTMARRAYHRGEAGRRSAPRRARGVE